MAQLCGYVVIDVNGPTKGPNNYGRDIYYFWITNGKGAILYPLGGIDDNFNNTNHWWKTPSPNSCSSGDKSGLSCAGRVMEENWEMNY